MVAANYTIRCQGIAIPAPVERHSSRVSVRPSELMLHAVPTIGQLVRKLQEEIRTERRLQSRNRHGENHRKTSLFAPRLAYFGDPAPTFYTEHRMTRPQVSFDRNRVNPLRNGWDADSGYSP